MPSIYVRQTYKFTAAKNNSLNSFIAADLITQEVLMICCTCLNLSSCSVEKDENNLNLADAGLFGFVT